MQIPKRPLHYLGLACAGISLLLCSGCVTVPAGYYANMLAYQPVRSPVQIDASATVAIAVTMTPEAIAFWKGYGGNGDADYDTASCVSFLRQLGQRHPAFHGVPKSRVRR
jgi:hypothetical protein